MDVHPEPVVVRAPRPEEAEAVAGLMNAHSLAEIGVEDTSPGEILSGWTEPGLDRGRDLIDMEDPEGRIVAYLLVDGREPWTRLGIDGYVHPDMWGRGLGTRLLALGEGRAAELAKRSEPGVAVILEHGVWSGTSGAALLEGAGFRPARHFHRMVLEKREGAAPGYSSGVTGWRSRRRARPCAVTAT